MKFKTISKKDKELTFELAGEDHTFSRYLVSALIDVADVEIAQYSVSHPETGQPLIYVKVNKGTPKDAIKKALKSMKTNLKVLAK